jgi:hypothetical protein
MIHKRNLTITALIWAAIITVVFLAYPRIHHGALGFFYWPVIVISVTISHFTGNGHSPSEFVGWASFGVYTILYWVIFLIVYVVLLEFYLLQQVLHHLDDAKRHLTADQPDPKAALERIGNAMAETESRRRKHFLLKPDDSIDLNEAPHLMAARAITRPKQSRLVTKLMARLQTRLSVGSSPTRARVHLADLRKSAENIVAGNSTGQSP